MGALLRRRESPGTPPGSPARHCHLGLGTFFLLLYFHGLSNAAELTEAETLFRAGKYDECAKLCDDEIAADGWTEGWRSLKISAEMARGKYTEALISAESAVRRFPTSISLRLQAREVYRYNGRQENAARAMEELERVVMGSPQRFATPEGRIALGRFFILKGADAKKVLDLFYDVAIKQRPDLVEAYLASAELALDKQDYALAAETLKKAPRTAAEESALSLPARPRVFGRGPHGIRQGSGRGPQDQPQACR